MPNKAHSKAQFRLLKGIESGSIPEKGSLTKEKAKEMLGGQSPNGLPERKGEKSLKKAQNTRHRMRGAAEAAKAYRARFKKKED
jgi:hypothetical protein